MIQSNVPAIKYCRDYLLLLDCIMQKLIRINSMRITFVSISNNR